MTVTAHDWRVTTLYLSGSAGGVGISKLCDTHVYILALHEPHICCIFYPPTSRLPRFYTALDASVIILP